MSGKEEIRKELESYCLEPEAVASIMSKVDVYEIEITKKRDAKKEREVREKTLLDAAECINQHRLKTHAN